jgi:lipopolysaccharide transport system ATP-binding protein
LTGRENIYLNGAILGMTRTEIRKKFDEIVVFAEVEKFLDTPAKRYSSGMYVRLAFAIAAHLEPEILVVDEVLALGDVDFQKRCLGKMQDIASTQGRTVVFVSHSLGILQSLCNRAIVLEHGRNAFSGNSRNSVRFYLRESNLQAEVQESNDWFRTGSLEARILSVRLEDDTGSPQTQFRMGEPLVIEVKARFSAEIQNPIFGVNIVTDTGIQVADCRSSHYDVQVGSVIGVVTYRMRIDSVTLYPRSYMIEPWITDSADLRIFDWVRNAARFLVTTGPNFLSGANINADHGVSFIPTSWQFRRLHVVAAPETHGNTGVTEDIHGFAARSH